MITTEEQFRQALEQLERMYHAVAALRADVLPVNTRQYALLVEEPLDQIRSLQEEMEAWLTCEVEQQKL
ncbi:MAG TPA: hypothetical protein VNO70_18350 [Blastocatellia bacterium]|nr:hypothetical protein [Blastocatellia bacterium]